MKPRTLLFLSLFALPAFAGEPDLIVNTSPSKEKLTKNNCATFQIEFACAEKKGGVPNGPNFQRLMQRRCTDEVHCPPTHADVPGCMKTCESNMRLDQLLVCDKCPALIEAGRPVVPPGNTGPVVTNPPVREPTGSTELDIRDQRDPRSPTHGVNDRPGRPACGSSEECFRAGADAQRRAEADARERQREYWRSMQEARNNQLSSITGASDVLSRWKSQMDQNPSAVTSDERARFQSDQRLVHQAHAALANPGSATFTPEDALRANDASVMRDLTMATESAAQMKQFEREEKQARGEAERLHVLAAETARRGDNLRSVPATQAPPAKVHVATAPVPTAGGLVTATPVSQSVNRGTLSASKSSDEKNDSRKAAPADPSSLTKADSAPAGAGAGAARSGADGLRELLRKRLEARGKAGAEESKGAAPVAAAVGGAVASENGSGSGFLETPAAESAVRVPASARSARANSALAEEVMAGLAGSHDKRFTLAGADAEVATGLLGRETASLFERVRHAVRSCLERECVTR